MISLIRISKLLKQLKAQAKHFKNELKPEDIFEKGEILYNFIKISDPKIQDYRF